MIARVAFVAALFALCSLSHGWWDEGHMLVAQIALERLRPEVAAVASALVAELSAQFPATNEFQSSAVWPDDLKTMAMPIFNSLHYVTIPYNPNPNYTAVPPPQDLNVVWAIQQFSAMLNATATIPYGQQMAIRFLLHFVGDIHQPLHTISQYSPQFPVPNGDLGGNFFTVYYNGTKTNLHSLMDSIFFKFLNQPIKRPLTAAGHAALQHFAAEAEQLNPPSSFTDSELSSLNVSAWALESNALAIQLIYLNGALTPGSNITADYATSVLALLERRIALAGYRLANLLNAFVPATYPPYNPVAATYCPSHMTKGGIAALSIAMLAAGGLIGGVVVWLFLGWRARAQALQKAYSEIPH